MSRKYKEEKKIHPSIFPLMSLDGAWRGISGR